MSHLDLKIIIPTYQRFDSLLKRLSEIKVCFESVSMVTVFDNGGAEEIKNHYPEVELISHESNIGMSKNLFACLGYAKTGWIWVLSDDDAIKEDAKEKISHLLNTQYAWISFGSCMNSSINYEKYVLELKGKSFISNEIFLSNTIYNMSLTSHYLDYGYSDSYIPQFFLKFETLKNNNIGLLSTDQIVYQNLNFIRWSPAVVFSVVLSEWRKRYGRSELFVLKGFVNYKRSILATLQDIKPSNRKNFKMNMWLSTGSYLWAPIVHVRILEVLGKLLSSSKYSKNRL